VKAPWTASQRGVLIALLSAILIYLIIRLIVNPVYVSDPQPPTPSRANELEDRIDPNTADLPTLAAMPLIGEKRAAEMIAYREKFAADHPGRLAFENPNDLLRIRGIGATTLAQLEPFLIFPTTAPATKP
jgi:DNA uptake protein ComE-like DNA-binding protein